MNWTRYKTLIISGGLCIILSAALSFWLLRTGRESQTLRDDISRLEQTQSRLVSASPYPSARNLEAMRAENEKVIAQRDQLVESIASRQFEVPTVTRARFGDYIRGQWVPELRRLARNSTLGGENGVILADPDFGMTEYLEGTLPETARLPSLLLEMEAISRVSRLLFDSGISELQAIQPVTETDERRPGTRSTAARVPGAPGPSAPGTGTRPGRQAEEEARPDDQVQMERMFDSLRLRISFNVYEDFLWETLNAILADENQLVVTRFSITNSNEQLWPEYLRSGSERSGRRRTEQRAAPARQASSDLMAQLAGTSDEQPAEPEESARGLPGLTERRRKQIGGDLLHVLMELKIYRLKPEVLTSIQDS